MQSLWRDDEAAAFPGELGERGDAVAKPIAGGAQLTWDVTVQCDGVDRPVLVAEWLTRILSA